MFMFVKLFTGMPLRPNGEFRCFEHGLLFLTPLQAHSSEIPVFYLSGDDSKISDTVLNAPSVPLHGTLHPPVLAHQSVLDILCERYHFSEVIFFRPALLSTNYFLKYPVQPESHTIHHTVLMTSLNQQ